MLFLGLVCFVGFGEVLRFYLGYLIEDILIDKFVVPFYS